MFNRNRKPNGEITPYSRSQSTGLCIDTLNKMRDTQVISNYEYMMLALQLEILNKLNSIDVSCKSTAVSNEFLGKYVLTKFKLYNRLEVSFCLAFLAAVLSRLPSPSNLFFLLSCRSQILQSYTS